MYERTRFTSEQYQPEVQEFHTFRNNQIPLEDTGRSIFSQQIDYRSLEKSHEHTLATSPRGRKLKNIRSQDKYKMLKQ